MPNIFTLWPICLALALLALWLLDADRRAARRDEREYGPEGLKAILDDMPVGECPFCGGAVHLGLERVDAGSFRIIKRECPGGCPLSCLLLNREVHGPTVPEARRNAARLWGEAVDAIENPADCGRCGARPVWRVRNGSCRLYCPKCGNEGPTDTTTGHAPDPEGAARLWDDGQETQRWSKDLEDKLNAA